MKLFPSFLRSSPGSHLQDAVDGGQSLDLATIEREAVKFRWHHRVQLAHGYTTPGIVGPDTIPDWEEKYLFPSAKELKGKSLLDIGTLNGLYAFEAEKRGASHVVAIDRDPTIPDDAREAFKFAAKVLGSRAIYRVRSVYDLEPSDFGTFDFVLMFGVLYHLKFPLYGLYRAASVCRSMFFLETHVTLKDDLSWPTILFYPNAELNNDGTSWWGPNPRCVDAMMDHLGFTIEKRSIWEQPGVVGLAPARYTVRCRRIKPTPAPFTEM